MRADLPAGEDLAELMVELRERGFDFFRLEAAARDSRLVGDDEHQMVMQGAELISHVGQELAYAWRQSTWSRTCANTSSRIPTPASACASVMTSDGLIRIFGK